MMTDYYNNGDVSGVRPARTLERATMRDSSQPWATTQSRPRGTNWYLYVPSMYQVRGYRHHQLIYSRTESTVRAGAIDHSFESYHGLHISWVLGGGSWSTSLV